MKRRDFIKITAVTSLYASAGFSCKPEQKKLKNWMWLRGGQNLSDADLKAFYQKLKDNGVHGILPDGSNEFYERVGHICKDIGMEFHAWRWTMIRAGYMKEHPDWYAVNRNGQSVVDDPPYVNYYRWLCPSKKEVEELLIKDYTNLCNIEGLTGVHLDYVRYCDVILPVALQPKYNLVQDHEMPQFDYCYCDTCRTKYKAEHGYDPMELGDEAENDDKWRQWRLDQLVTLVNKIADSVHKTGKLISAAVFPTPEIARRLVRQDWARFNLDAFMPMAYFQDYNGDLKWLADTVKRDADLLKGKAGFYPGLHLGHSRQYGIEKVINTCLENGAQGVTFFLGNEFTDEDWKVFKRVADK
jgi:uncharacterized lipoprotein YddW (UPF0748 family)